MGLRAFLLPAMQELNRLMPLSEPLAKPEEITERMYNSGRRLEADTEVPRLLWALEDAKKQGLFVPERAPLEPQRAPIAFRKLPAKAVKE